jgi:Type II secretion system (T2SS), protein G
MIIIVLFQDRDMVYTGRIYRAQYDVAAIDSAIDLYAKKVSHFPHDLSDLVTPTDQVSNDNGFLPHVPKSPWNTPYHLNIEHIPQAFRMLRS